MANRSASDTLRQQQEGWAPGDTMWFGIGIITLLCAFAFSLHLRTQALWKGEPRIGPGGLPYVYNETRSKQGKVTRVRIGLPAPEKLVFKVREEDIRDRLSKWAGLSVELQARDAAFDHTIYLESDLHSLANLLRSKEALRDALLRIVDMARPNELKSLCIRCAVGRVWVEYTPNKQHTDAAVMPELLEQLQIVSQSLQAHAAELQAARDPFFRSAAVLLSIASAMAALGGYGLLRATVGRTDIIEAWSLFLASVLPGLVVLGCLLALVVGIVGRSSRTHTVLFEVALVGGAGVIMAVYSLAREANIDFDMHASAPHEVHGISVEHRVTNGRRGRKRHTYYLHAPDWRADHAGRSLRLQIDSNLYRALENTSDAVVFTKPGALGYEWVDRVERSRSGTATY